jgi:hypothetical protein
MVRPILFGVGIVLLAAMVFPIARDAYERNQVISKLDPILSQQDRQAFQAWQGDALSFAKSLYARCQLANGQSAKACEPYRLAQD